MFQWTHALLLLQYSNIQHRDQFNARQRVLTSCRFALKRISWFHAPVLARRTCLFFRTVMSAVTRCAVARSSSMCMK